MKMRNVRWMLLFVLLFVVAGCQANVQDRVICPLIGQAGTCRVKGTDNPGLNEKDYESVSLNNQVGIFTNPFSTSNERAYEVITGFGLKPYPKDYTILVQKGSLDFKSEAKPESCSSFSYRCTSTLEDVTLEYTLKGTKYTRLIGVDINGTIPDLNVSKETLTLWTPIIQSDFQTDGTALFFTKFWTWFRVEGRSINLGEFDPIADQWGSESKLRIGNAMLDTFNTKFPYKQIATIGTLSIRHLYPDNNAAGGVESGDNQSNPSVIATSDAVEIHKAEILATQSAIFCKDSTEPLALALCKKALVERLNGQSTGGDVIVPVFLPTAAPAG